MYTLATLHLGLGKKTQKFIVNMTSGELFDFFLHDKDI